MKGMIATMMAVAIVMGSGCASTEGGKLSYNMTQSVSRSAGDVSMTALLDEGVDPVKGRVYAETLAELIDEGTLNKAGVREAAFDAANAVGLTGAADYIDALLAVVPVEYSEYERIPEKYRRALVSFLRDGAVRAVDLYVPIPVVDPDVETEEG